MTLQGYFTFIKPSFLTPIKYEEMGIRVNFGFLDETFFGGEDYLIMPRFDTKTLNKCARLSDFCYI